MDLPLFGDVPGKLDGILNPEPVCNLPETPQIIPLTRDDRLQAGESGDHRRERAQEVIDALVLLQASTIQSEGPVTLLPVADRVPAVIDAVVDDRKTPGGEPVGSSDLIDYSQLLHNWL